MTSRGGSTIGYTSYNLPNVIYAGSNSSTLSYGAYRNRFKQVAVTAGVSETTVYVGGILEKVTRSGATTWRHRIEGPGGLLAIVNCSGASCDPTTTTHYVHRDHLGSPELVTNSSGTEVVKLSFGAFGERRDRDWHGAVSSADMTAIGNSTRRGFTEHEHLDSVGLIHMNGRVYDPVLGRFLASDPVADGLGGVGGFNRYAYVHNNPLTLIDPSGLSSKETRLPQHDAGRLGSLTEGVPWDDVLVRAKRIWSSLGGTLGWTEVPADSFRAGHTYVPTPDGGGGGGGSGGSDGGGGGDNPNGREQPSSDTKDQEEPAKEGAIPDTCHAISSALGGAVAGATFALLAGQGALALHYAGAFGAIAGITSLLAPSGGFGAFVVAGHVGAVALARGGSSQGSFADVVGGAAGAATPLGPATVPIGAAAGAVGSAVQTLHFLGRAGSAIVGGSAGGLAAATGLSTSAVVSAALGCQK